MTEYRSDIQKAWYAEMRAKYNTNDDGVRKIMRDRQKKSMASPKRLGKPHRGGFSNPELARAAGMKGRKTRWAKDEED